MLPKSCRETYNNINQTKRTSICPDEKLIQPMINVMDGNKM